MTDAHCHFSASDPTVRELLVGRDFFGTHPWQFETYDASRLRERLSDNPEAGVGEIGLDRLKAKEIPPRMREVFEEQLALAMELNRPLVLHGAKCWGQVVSAVRAAKLRFPGYSRGILFHGFSRSDGLIPDIVTLGGYISVGPAVLNDHAVNYREMARKIPRDRLLVETDRDAEEIPPTVSEVAEKLAVVLGLPVDELERLVDVNVRRYLN